MPPLAAAAAHGASRRDTRARADLSVWTGDVFATCRIVSFGLLLIQVRVRGGRMSEALSCR